MSKNQNRGQSQVVGGDQYLQNASISINPITMDDTNPDISKSAVKPKLEKNLDPIGRRDSQNS